MPPMINRVGSPPTRWRLDVVMPVYNERGWVRGAVAAVAAAASEAGCEMRVIVVDDGSDDDESRQVLDELATRPDVVLVRQTNAGRFAARVAGLERVDTDHVLLLDARVEVDPSALSRIRRALEEGADVWNFDVNPGSHGMGALFWSGITKVWWRDYFQDRRRVAFGDADFDRFPKGTTAFFAPTVLMLEAVKRFDSFFTDTRLASDDTRLLRLIASQTPIHLSPEITCRHHNKAGARQWARQCYYRGTTFVDGYLTNPARAKTLLWLLGGVGVTGLAAVAKAPDRVAWVGVTGAAAAAVMTRRCGGSLAESASVGMLSAPFGTLFGAGIVRGLRLAASSRD